MQIEIDKSIGRKGGLFGLTPTFARLAFVLLVLLFIAYVALSALLSPFACLAIVVLTGTAILITLKVISHKYGDDGLGKFYARRQLPHSIKATTTLRRILSPPR